MSEIEQFSYDEVQLNSDINYNSNDSFIEEQKSNCPFCPKLFNFLEKARMVNRALYYKYSSSQNYFYSKEINNFTETPTDIKIRSKIINFQDLIAIQERNDYLTKLFTKSEKSEKLQFLVEYYKYHNEIPRLFLQSLQKKINKYHDKKRQIQYFRIKRMLESRNNKNKDIVQEGQEDKGKTIKYTRLLKQLDLSKSMVVFEKSIIKENPLLTFQFFKESLNKEEQFQQLNKKQNEKSISLQILIKEQSPFIQNSNYSISVADEKINDETVDEYNQYIDFILKSTNINLQDNQQKYKQIFVQTKAQNQIKEKLNGQKESQEDTNTQFLFKKVKQTKESEKQVTSNEFSPNSSQVKTIQKAYQNNYQSSEESQSSYNQININHKQPTNRDLTKAIKSPSQESIQSSKENSKMFKLAPQKILGDNNNEIAKQIVQNVNIKFGKNKSKSNSKYKKDLKLQDSIIKNPIKLQKQPYCEHRGPSPDLTQEKVKNQVIKILQKKNFDFNSLNQLKAQTTKFSERKVISGKNFSDLQKKQNMEAHLPSEIEASQNKPNSQYQQQQQIFSELQQQSHQDKPNFRSKPSTQAKFQLLEIYSSTKNQQPLIAHTQHFLPQQQLNSVELSKMYCASLISFQSQKQTLQLQPKSFQAETDRKNNFQRRTDRSGDVGVRSLMKRNLKQEGAFSQGRKGLSENRMRENHSVRRLTNIQSQLLPQQNCTYGWQSQRANSLTKLSRQKSQSPQILVRENQMQNYKDLQKQLTISNQKNKSKRIIQFASVSQNQKITNNNNLIPFQPYQQTVRKIQSPKAQKIHLSLLLFSILQVFIDIKPAQMKMSYKAFAKSQVPLAVQQQNIKQKITIQRTKSINKFIQNCVK